MQVDREEIEKMDRKYRLNLVNSASGIKPANLIGTRSVDGQENVAIFSSIVHLGSNPAQLGFVMRPPSDPPRDTYPNILDTGYYTINHVSTPFIKKAHYTSAKLDRDDSEFNRMKIDQEYVADFHAPFVKESLVKLGMKYMDSVPLPNGCTFVIGTVELLICPDHAVNTYGQIDLESYDCAGISGLNTYYKLTKVNSFPYVRTHELPNFL